MKSPPSSSPPAVPSEHGVGALLLFVSGAVAIVYEVIWQRQFGLVFGSVAPATATVLAAYFAGLGLGSFTLGRLAPRWNRPLLAYAVLEAAVGAGALLVAPALSGLDAVFVRLRPLLHDQPWLLVAVRTAGAFTAIFIPTFGMGGTLPVLGQMADRGRRQLGLTAGWLYVANTAGAALGALAFPFFLLPRLGLAGSTWFGAAVNGGLACTAWWLDARTAIPLAPSTADRNKRRAAEVGASVALGAALISGVVTFALQVLWNRAFAQVHENSMYPFAVIVAVVIAALAAGAQLARLGLRRKIEPHRLIGGAWVLAGGTVMLGPWLFLSLSDGLAYLSSIDGNGHALSLAGLAVAVLLAPMTLLGVAMPAIMEQSGRLPEGNTAHVLGRVLAVNTAGSVAGALAAGFILPAWLGLWGSMVWIGALLLAAGCWQWTRRPAAGRGWKPALILGAGWLASLGLIAHLALPRVRLAPGEEEQLVSLSEGAYGITAVVERPGSRRLKLNNHYGLGGTASTGDERMQAHLPLLLHPAPRRVAFLGVGTGITAGGALFHPVESVTVVELVPDVVTAARRHFRVANGGVLDDPRTRVVSDDARHFLRAPAERYDVIIGDLVVPWRQGEASLFTLEQFTAAREALAPGGLFCQWLPLFQLSETEVNILVRTFLTVFPRAQVWRGDFSPEEPAIALIGRADGAPPDGEMTRRRLVAMHLDPANPQLKSPDAFWMNLVGVFEARDLPADEIRLNSEDRPWIELLGPGRPAGGNADRFLTGRRLQLWLDQVRNRSRERLGTLTEREWTDVTAGGVLGEFTLCLNEGNRDGAQDAQQRLKNLLTEETFRLLFP